MTKSKLILLASIVAATSAVSAGGGRAAGSEFQFTPVPRWQEEPEAADLCVAIKKECPALAGKSDIDVEIGMDELYDASGKLVGMRLTKSSGCKPIDESTLLGQRKFKLDFHHEGKPDLDDIHAELAPGVNPDGVRIVKRGGTSLNLDCSG